MAIKYKWPQEDGIIGHDVKLHIPGLETMFFDTANLALSLKELPQGWKAKFEGRFEMPTKTYNVPDALLEIYTDAKDCLVVAKHFGNWFDNPLIAILAKDKASEILDKAYQLEEEEKKKNKV